MSLALPATLNGQRTSLSSFGGASSISGSSATLNTVNVNGTIHNTNTSSKSMVNKLIALHLPSSLIPTTHITNELWTWIHSQNPSALSSSSNNIASSNQPRAFAAQTRLVGPTGELLDAPDHLFGDGTSASSLTGDYHMAAPAAERDMPTISSGFSSVARSSDASAKRKPVGAYTYDSSYYTTSGAAHYGTLRKVERCVNTRPGWINHYV